VQEIVVAEQNKFNIFLRDIFTGIKKKLQTCILLVSLYFVYFFTLLKKQDSGN